jgi:hypothetical protein
LPHHPARGIEQFEVGLLELLLAAFRFVAASPHISQTFLVGVQSRSGVSLAQALIGHRFQDGDYGSE